jgi:hypothetical protein
MTTKLRSVQNISDNAWLLWICNAMIFGSASSKLYCHETIICLVNIYSLPQKAPSLGAFFIQVLPAGNLTKLGFIV